MGALQESVYEDDIVKQYDGCEYKKEIGVLLENEDILFEVIDGLVCVKSKPTTHDVSKTIITDELRKALNYKRLPCKAYCEMRMLRGKSWANDFLIPDVSVFSFGECELGENGMLLGIPKLAVEVMSSNRNDDINRKRLVYANMGIPEYWVVDLDGCHIIQYVLEGNSYGKKSLTHNGGQIKHHVCGLELNVEDLFDLIKSEIEFLINSNMNPTNLFG